MTLSSSIFGTLWGTAVLAWLALSYQYKRKRKGKISQLGDEIRSYNARNGYDQSLGREALASDLSIPFISSHNIRRFAENNGVSVEEYQAELESHTGHPTAISWAIFVQILGVIYTLGGFSYFTEWGFIPPTIYLLLNLVLLGFSFFLYWVL